MSITTELYKITLFNPGTSFEMEAYDNYWGGKPGLSEMIVFNIEDDNTRALVLQSGDVDVAKGNFDFFFRNIQTLSREDPQWLLEDFFTIKGNRNSGKYSDKALNNLVKKLSITFDESEREKIAREAS